MKEFKLRLIGESRALRREQTLQSPGGRELWSAVSCYAARYGRDGEHVQVVDEVGEIVIRVGVATARSSLHADSVAA